MEIEITEDRRILDGIEADDPKAIERAIAEGSDPNGKYNGFPNLFYAARHDKVDCLRTLVENGADPLAKDDMGYDALVGVKGDRSIDYLTEKGVNPQQAFFAAVEQSDFGTAEKLLDKGAKVNELDENGQTALHTLVAFGATKAGMEENREGMDMLLQRGADPRTPNADGELPSEYARASGNDGIGSRLESEALKLKAAERMAMRENVPRRQMEAGL